MKKIILIICVFCIHNSSFAQFEIIDKIAGTLLPKVFEGIKSIKDASRSNKDKEITKLDEALKAHLKIIVNSIEDQQKNLDGINSLFENTGPITDNLGALKALSREEFLDAIIKVDNHKLYIETAMNFDDFLTQVESINTQIQKLDITNINAELRALIKIKLVNLKDKLALLSRRVRRGKLVTASMTFTEAQTYVKNINRSETRDDIRLLESSVNDINVLLSAWIDAGSEGLKENKKQFEELTKEK